MNTAGYKILDLSMPFSYEINKQAQMNNKNEEVNVYKNTNLPKFKYYNDDTNLNLTSKFIPPYTYKNKSIFPSEKPIQTEHDEIGINESFLNSYYGYTNYGNYNVANQSLPENWKHKITPKNYLFDLN